MVADRTHAAALDLGADGLGGVFHQGDPLRPGDLGQGHGVDGLAEQVDGDDGLGGRGDQRGDVFGSILKVCGSMSAKTGRAPRRVTALAVAKNVKLGRITSSPAEMSRAIRASSRASLPEAQADSVLGLAVGGQFVVPVG